MLKKIVILLSLFLWPLNFFLNYDKTGFATETVFKNDYQGEQLVLRNIQLYPTPLMARIFQNKPRIYINKFAGNFFALTDPNYYFFASHPEPITGRLNTFKFPFLSIIFFMIGIFHINKNKYHKVILSVLAGMILLLSALVDFEGFSIVLWLPISLIIIHGVNIAARANKKYFTVFALIFILFSATEILRGPLSR